MPSLASHPIASAAAPPRALRAHVAFQPGLYGNDALGDCTAAGIANCARAVAACNGFDFPITDADVIGFYSASTGYVAGDAATDRGGIETAVLTHQLQNGFLMPERPPLVGQWATIDPADSGALRNIIARVGAIYLGVNLAVADQSMDVWDTVSPPEAGDPTPGSWGGHCLVANEFDGIDDDSLVTLLTWGTRKQATWRWLHNRMDEAHAIIWREIAAPDGRNFAGIDMDKLLADNATWAAQASAFRPMSPLAGEAPAVR